MKKCRGSWLLIFILIMTGMMAGGCGQYFDHGAYLCAVLDAAYKGEYARYIAFTGYDEAALQAEREEELRLSAQSFAVGVAFDDEQMERISVLLQKVYEGASYEVEKVTRIDDDHFQVDMKVRPVLNLVNFSGALSTYAGQWQERMAGGEFDGMTRDETEAVGRREMLEMLESGIQELVYGDEVTQGVSVFLDHESEMWSVPAADY